MLAILAMMTTLAFRSLDQVVDQRRYEASNQILQEIEEAVVGASGNPVPAGSFVADMGRLPKTVQVTEVRPPPLDPLVMMTLRELWDGDTLPAYDVRAAAVDPEVLVPGGWRGPYLQMPLDANEDKLLDGWGNPMHSLVSPVDPLATRTTGYARLRTDSDAEIVTANEPVFIIRHLGANGSESIANSDKGADRDLKVDFTGRVAASVKATVEILEDDGSPGTANGTDEVVVRVFGPNLDVAERISVKEKQEDFGTSVVTVPAAAEEYIIGATCGPRTVRAYLYADGETPANPLVGAPNPPIAKSSIKQVTLRPGVNFVHLTIYRPAPVVPP